MGTIIVNPGSGPVSEATEKHAIENIKHFIADCSKAKEIKWVRIPAEDYKDGRFAFLLWNECCCHEIQMPGLPLENVRYMGEEKQNIWDFPRLYVDGSSWVWCFAILNEKNWTQPNFD